MIYFRELPVPLRELNDDFFDFFFKFANLYTEDSIMRGYLKEVEEKNKEITAESLAELGYSDEDIMKMNL